MGNREEKVLDMLSTMGASILTGAVSTFLGTAALAFSSSKLFFTIFVAFVGMVLLGTAHGLILLPVLLSMFGPEDEQSTRVGEEEEDSAGMDTVPSPSAPVSMSAVIPEDQEASGVAVKGMTFSNVQEQEPKIAVD